MEKLGFRSKIVQHISLNWLGLPSVTPRKLLSQDVFAAMLRIERRRVHRSQRPFVLMLLDIDVLFHILPMDTALQMLISAISTCTRETDLVGWYEMGSTLGIIFAGLNSAKRDSVTVILVAKTVSALQKNLGPSNASQMSIAVHCFPETCDPNLLDRTDIDCASSENDERPLEYAI